MGGLYGIVPDIAGRVEHTLMFGDGFTCPTRKDVKAIGEMWKVTDADAIVDRVITSVRTFRSLARRLRVGGGRRLDEVARDVERRVTLLEG
jgi:hypothetical protein